VSSSSYLTSRTPTKPILYLVNSLAAAVSEPALYSLLAFQVSNLVSLLLCLGHTNQSRSEDELLAPRPTPKLENHPSSAVRDCLFNIFVATVHFGDRPSIHNLKMRMLCWQESTYHGIPSL